MKHQLTLGDASKINPDKGVRVYRNLHKGCYSVQQEGIVVAHLDELELSDCSFIVSQAGRNKCLREQKKNVHAFIVGKFVSGELGVAEHESGSFVPVGYNPYKCDGFRTFCSPLGDPVTFSPLVSILGKSVHAVL